MIKGRDRYKKHAQQMVLKRHGGSASDEEMKLWNIFKQLRNKVNNNRKKIEEAN